MTTTLFTGANLTGTALVNLSAVCSGGIGCAELTDAELSCADFTLTDISDFAVRDGLDALVTDDTMLFQFVDSDLSGIKLVSKGLSGYDFSNRDLTRADLSGTLFDSADFVYNSCSIFADRFDPNDQNFFNGNANRLCRTG